MDFSTLKALSIPEGVVKKIEVNGVVLWEEPSSYKNWVKYSTESDGVTIYNGGLGYKNGYRVRSGGAESSGNDFVCTGFIPFKKGDVLLIHPSFNGGNSWNTINFSDASFTNLGQVTDSGSLNGICTGKGSLYKSTLDGNVSKLIYTDEFDNSIAYIRVTHRPSSMTTLDDFIITINEEIV